jgi:hypothetical protein
VAHLRRSLLRSRPRKHCQHSAGLHQQSFSKIRGIATSSEVCHIFPQSNILLKLCRNFVDEFIQEHHIQCSRALDVQLKMEKTPFTQNSHYLESSKEKWLSIYKGARAKKVAPPGATGTASRPQPAPSQSPIRTGSSKTPYKAFLENVPADSSTVLHYQNISIMPAYRGSSVEVGFTINHSLRHI